jgi:hypothetical protein
MVTLARFPDLGGNFIRAEAGAWCECHAWNRRDYTELPRRGATSQEKTQGL